MLQKTSFFLVVLITTIQGLQAQKTLWQIGKTDQDYHEFALAPDGYSSYAADGFFVAGASEAGKDWPYCHPGPADSWAGSQPHTFSVIFGLSKVAAKGPSELIIDLVDTHQGNPGSIQVSINGHELKQKLPGGGGDVTIYGEVQDGKAYSCRFEFPVDWLQPGDNELDIDKPDGSWMLYDALRMEIPKGTKSSQIGRFIQLTDCRIDPVVRKRGNQTSQDLSMVIKYAGKTQNADLMLNDKIIGQVVLQSGVHKLSLPIPEIRKELDYELVIKTQKEELASLIGKALPPRHRAIYILPHSHTDIGYTDVQTAIEDKQVKNLITGIQYAKETQDYPEGSRFVWNVEVGWAADLYLNRLGEEEKKVFIDALQKGWISLNGMYLNELTGLCRPEELLRLFRFGTKMAEQTGATVNSAMISDVPGYTWGTVTAMAQAGIKYFSVAPNYFDRIGDILVQWENKPFYWSSPSGKEQVLVWIPYKGYAWSHTINKLNEKHALAFLSQLDQMDYPYDIAYMRWSGHGDNAVPEKQISDFVRDWNESHAWPRFVISSTGEAFSAFEEQYGDQLETFAGDWTPYWEDGAGSSALETGMNRNTAERLTQAEALYALTDSKYPTDYFERAWTHTLLYSEHTWGAWCSITDPENQLTKDQWEIKKGYADEANRMSKELINKLISSPDESGLIEMVNTTAWARSEVITLDTEQSKGYHSIIDQDGRVLPSQKLSNGSLAFLPNPIEAFSSETYQLSKEKKRKLELPHPVKVQLSRSENITLSNGLIEVVIEGDMGNIQSIRTSGSDHNFADNQPEASLNQYLFFEGRDLDNLETSGSANIRILEHGPLVGVVEVQSTAPGCHSLLRRYQLNANQDLIHLENIVDKKRAPMPEKTGDWYLAQNENKESVNFAFPFNIPDGIMRLDLPIGNIIPWENQIPSACKNWYSVGRYADISNEHLGITWFTLDAPLVEVGEISATLVGSQSDPDVWRKEVEPTQKLYSWAMNNHWGTNYRQYQEGPVRFRYALRPHEGYQAAEAYRLATAMTQPLLVSKPVNFATEAPVTLQSDNLVLFSLKPTDSGKGFLARIYNPGSEIASGLLQTSSTIWLSDTSEKKIRQLEKNLKLAPMEILTVYVE